MLERLVPGLQLQQLQQLCFSTCVWGGFKVEGRDQGQNLVRPALPMLCLQLHELSGVQAHDQVDVEIPLRIG